MTVLVRENLVTTVGLKFRCYSLQQNSGGTITKPYAKYADEKVVAIISIIDNQSAGDEGCPSTMNCNGCTWKMRQKEIQ